MVMLLLEAVQFRMAIRALLKRRLLVRERFPSGGRFQARFSVIGRWILSLSLSMELSRLGLRV
jgi:hypothetical protein